MERKNTMIEWNSLFLFFIALITVYLTPGPDMVLVMTVSSENGKGPGIFTAIGIGCARSIHVFASGLGLAHLFSRFPVFYHFVRIAGALYLFWMAYQFYMTARLNTPETTIDSRDEKFFFHGFITNILNPKALIFCSILLPQFLYSPSIPLIHQFLFLGTILVLTGFLFDLLYATLSVKIVKILKREKDSHLQKYFAPPIFVCLGAYLLIKA